MKKNKKDENEDDDDDDDEDEIKNEENENVEDIPLQRSTHTSQSSIIRLRNFFTYKIKYLQHFHS
jgi:hypothetical protein